MQCAKKALLKVKQVQQGSSSPVLGLPVQNLQTCLCALQSKAQSSGRSIHTTKDIPARSQASPLLFKAPQKRIVSARSYTVLVNRFTHTDAGKES